MQSPIRTLHRFITSALTVAILAAICPALASASDPHTDTLQVSIYYRQSSAKYKPGWRGNAATLRQMRAAMPADAIVTEVAVVSGYSPEGEEDFNRWLCQERGKSALDALAGVVNIDSAAVKVECNARSFSDAKTYADMRAARLTIIYYEPVKNPVVCLPPNPPVVQQAAVNTGAMLAQAPDEDIHTRKLKIKVKRPHYFFMNVRTNALFDFFAFPNAGVEFYLDRNWTMGVDGIYAWWHQPAHNRYWRLQAVEAWCRKYFGKRPFTGHHLGVYGQVLRYDFCTSYTSMGYLSGGPGKHFDYHPTWGVGLEYGYSLPIGRRIRLDFSIGFGYLTGRYVTYYNFGGHNVWQRTLNRHWYGPTRAEASFVWVIGEGGKI